MSRLNDILWDYDPQFQEPLTRLREATSLALMVMAVWTVVQVLAVRLLEEVLTGRAQQPETCPFARVWATAAEQRFPRAGTTDAIWGDPLAAAGGAVSARLCGVTSGAVGSGVRGIATPTHGGGSAMDGLSVGGICAV